MTYVWYNGVTLANCEIVSVEQNIVYDRSQTDQIAVATVLTARGTLFSGSIADDTRPNILSRGGAALAGPQSLIAALSRPRRRLRVYKRFERNNEIDLWDVIPADPQGEPKADQDCDGGPKPLGAVITNTHRWGYDVEFRIQFTLQSRTPDEYHSEAGTIDWALNNRWTCVEAFDQDFFCSKTYSGTIRLTQAVPAAQVFARLLAFPQLEPGFRRESAEYAVSETGLEISYRIQDRQVAHAAPWPATRMEVAHSETLQQLGYLMQSSCSVQLWGPPGVSKPLLLARVAQILRNRLLWDELVGNASFVESMRIVDRIGEQNSVSGELVISRYPAASGGGEGSPAEDFIHRVTGEVLGTDIILPELPPGAATEAAEKALGPTPSPGDPLRSIRPHPFGYASWGDVRDPALIMFFACYYQVPEHPPHHFHPGLPNPPAPPGASQKGSGDDAAAWYARPQPSPSLVAAAADSSALSRSHAEAVYTFASVRNDYDMDCGREAWTKTYTGDDEGDEVEVVETRRAKLVRRMIYDAERTGDWPEIPAPTDYRVGDGYARILRWRVQPQPPSLAADGEHLIYRVQAQYEWAITRSDRADVLDAGTLPYIRPERVVPLKIARYANPQLMLASADRTTFDSEPPMLS